MNAPKTIGVYYATPHRFADVLKALRRYYPEAKITGIVPKGYTLKDAERPFVDEAIETELTRYPKTALPALVRLIRLIRAQRYDLFIVFFGSIRHRFIAGASAAGRCECWIVDGYTVPITNSIAKVPAQMFRNFLRGRMAYWKLWFNVHLKSVKTKKPVS